jgi:hypothetical protein
MMRNVKGILFADYVRMMRRRKDVNWTAYVERADLIYLRIAIDPADWYPMGTFERFGVAIIEEVAQGNPEAARLWGRFSVDALAEANPNLVVVGDPVGTLTRFRAERETYFDFNAIEVRSLTQGLAEIVIHYYMGAKAEEAASYQTMGFFERLLEVGGGTNVKARFATRSWAPDELRTVLRLEWS